MSYELYNDALQEFNLQDISISSINIIGGGGDVINSNINIDISNLSNLINTVETYRESPNDNFNRFHTYIYNNNFEGEIRFYTLDALNNNDFNKNLITGNYSEPRLTFNTKIAEDGYIYCYYTFNFFDNQIKPSGWYNLIREIAQVQNTTDATTVALGVVTANVGSLNTAMITVQQQIIALFFSSNEQAILNNFLQDQIDKAEEKLLTELLTEAEKTIYTDAKKRFSDGLQEFLEKNSMIDLFDLRKIAFESFNIGFDIVQNALIGLAIIGGIYAIYDSRLIQQKENELSDYYKQLNAMEKNGYNTNATGLLISGLLISPANNNGFTTNGKYEVVAPHANASVNGRIYIEVYDDPVALIKKARILDVIEPGTGYAVGYSIFILRSNLGGGTGSLLIDITAVGDLKKLMVDKIDTTQSTISNLNNNIRRRQLIPNRDDFGDGINITETSDYLESGEELPKIDISLKVDLDDFYFDSGILKTLKVSFYKLDGLINSNDINSSWSQVVKDIKNNTYPNRDIMRNVFMYHANRLIGVKPTKTDINALNEGVFKSRNTIVYEEMVKNIFFEMTELVTYWERQIKIKPSDPDDLIINKINNLYLQFGLPIMPPPEDFSIPNGIFIVNDLNGYGVKLFIELTNGIMSNRFFIDYGSDNIPAETAINFTFSEIGGYTGATPFFTIIAYLDNNFTYHTANILYSNTIIDTLIGNQRHRMGILTNRTFIPSINPNSGIKQINHTVYDNFSGQNVTSRNFKVNINANDFYILGDGTGEIALNLANKINTSLNYNPNTRKIGLNPNIEQICAGLISDGNINNAGFDILTRDINCRNITCETITKSGDLITEGNLSIIDLTCRTITSTGNFTNQGFNLLTNNIQCLDITSVGDLDIVDINCDNIIGTGNIDITNNIKCNKIRIGDVANQPVFNLHVKCEAGTYQGLHLDASTTVGNNGFEHCFSLNSFNTANANKAFGFRIINPNLDFNSMSFNPDGSVDVALAFTAGTIGCDNTMTVGGDITHQANLNTKIIDCTNLNSKGDVYVYSANESSSIALRFGTPFTGSYTGITKSAIIAEALGSWSRHNLHFCLNTEANNTATATIDNSFMSLRNDNYIYMNKPVGINGAPDATTKLLVNGNSLITGTLKVNSTSRFEADATFTKDVYVEDNLYIEQSIVGNYHISGRFFSVGSSGTDKLGVQSEPALGTNSAQLIIRVIHNSFTEFHRCYCFDPLFDVEKADDFKNNYVGRIVISTGKIKTDYTTYDDKNEPVWDSKIDKEGITIEDALPIVQLSRLQKDKRVFGVLGDPTRNTNNPERLIVNAVGEGGIMVVNTNGNIENGDYIQSSDIIGYGEKQDDDLLHNYTVAKATMYCFFELNSPYYQCYEIADGVRVAFLACVYYCG